MLSQAQRTLRRALPVACSSSLDATGRSITPSCSSHWSAVKSGHILYNSGHRPSSSVLLQCSLILGRHFSIIVCNHQTTWYKSTASCVDMKQGACGALSTREKFGWFVEGMKPVKQNDACRRDCKPKGRWRVYAAQEEYETDGHLLTNLSPGTFCTFTLWPGIKPQNHFSSSILCTSVVPHIPP